MAWLLGDAEPGDAVAFSADGVAKMAAVRVKALAAVVCAPARLLLFPAGPAGQSTYGW